MELIIDYRGKTPKKLGGDWSEKGIPAISAKNIKKNSIVNFESIRYVDDDLYSKWMKEEIKKGDILITSEAPCGEVLLWDTDEKVVLSQRLYAVRPKKHLLDSKFFVYYAMSSQFQHELNARLSGSTVFGIRQEELRKTKVILPPLETQRKIASILSSLDSKIETNNKIISNLEEQAHQLFKHWFVDFEFPNENGQAYKSSGGRMVESELGLIPKGWEIGCLKDDLSLVSGYSFKSSDYTPNGKYKISTIKNVGNGRFLITENDSKIELLPENIKKEQILIIGDILISLTGEVGRVCLVSEKDYLLNQRVAKILPKKEIYYEYLYFLLLQHSMKRKIENISTGSIQKNVSTNKILQIKTIVPEEFVVRKFHKITKQIIQEVQNLTIQNKFLSEIRDLLLQKLMSGEIDVEKLEI